MQADTTVPLIRSQVALSSSTQLAPIWQNSSPDDKPELLLGREVATLDEEGEKYEELLALLDEELLALLDEEVLVLSDEELPPASSEELELL